MALCDGDTAFFSHLRRASPHERHELPPRDPGPKWRTCNDHWRRPTRERVRPTVASVAVAIVDLAASAIDVDDAFAVTAPEEEEEDRRLEAGPLLGEAAIISPLFMTRHKEQEV